VVLTGSDQGGPGRAPMLRDRTDSMLIGHGWTVQGKSVTFAGGLAAGLTVRVVELSVRLPLDDSGQFNLTLREHLPRQMDLA